MQIFMNADTYEWYFELKSNDKYFEEVRYATIAYDIKGGHQICGFLFSRSFPIPKQRFKVAKQRLHEVCTEIIYSYQ